MWVFKYIDLIVLFGFSISLDNLFCKNFSLFLLLQKFLSIFVITSLCECCDKLLRYSDVHFFVFLIVVLTLVIRVFEILFWIIFRKVYILYSSLLRYREKIQIYLCTQSY